MTKAAELAKMGEVLTNSQLSGRYKHIKINPNNKSYQAILKWAEIEGNTIEEAD